MIRPFLPAFSLTAFACVLAAAPAHAACELVRGNGTVMVVVGTKVGTCIPTEGFRDAFVAELRQALEPGQGREARPTVRRAAPKVLQPPTPSNSERSYGQR